MDTLQKRISRSAEIAPLPRGMSSTTFAIAVFAAGIAIVLGLAVLGGALFELSVSGRIDSLRPYALAGLLTGILYAVPHLVFATSARWPGAAQGASPSRQFEIWTFANLILVLVSSASGDGALLSYGYLATFYVIGLAALTVLAMASSALRARLVESGLIRGRRILVLGAPAELETMTKRAENSQQGFHVVAAEALPVFASCESRAAMLKSVDDVMNRARALEIDDIIVSSTALADADIMARLSGLPASVHVQTVISLDRYAGVRVAQFSELSALTVSLPPLAPLQRLCKRAFDIALASLAVVALFPLLTVVAIMIKLSSPGPVIFFQRRRGFNMAEFRIWKFRTMTVAESGADLAPADQDQSRLTWIGRRLRRFNIDELPQLINVIKGDMTIVGPRPHAIDEDDLFSQWIETYSSRARVVPGITGWAQVNGCRGRASTMQVIRKRVEYDKYYIENWSMMFDLYIIFLTLFSPKAYRNAR
jgi:exopolysaccharide biosynthesis polyprenyl glycosylphosphotransferase